MTNPEACTRHYHETGALGQAQVKSFRTQIYAHYHANPRPMPWRETRDPYRILVSEIMLQQTQVERVKPKYHEFVEAFPSVAILAAAPLSEVLRIWQGLGYNRRALALKRCAEEIVNRFDGHFPVYPQELETLPGIGHYTARAVATFAFDAAEPFIETNIRTVFIHMFFSGRDNVSDREIMALVAATLDQANPREWYYALMDYGVMIKASNPNPGRRSAHHTRQSSFKGSNRELRSRMLRAIMAEPGVTAGQLADELTADRSAVLKNLESLKQEGFLEPYGQGYRVRGETQEG